jgi:CHAT domain-containing protein/Tfp pilus assembly protein PilF
MRGALQSLSLVLLFVAAAAPLHAAPDCAEGAALRVTEVSPAIAAEASGLRPGDRLLSWNDAGGVARPLCSLLDLAEAELERGTLAPIALRVRRAEAEIDATLAGGRQEVGYDQRGDGVDALASRRLIALRAAASTGAFDEARAQLETLPALEPARRALALELAIGWFEPDPDRSLGFALLDELMILRESAPPRARARALALRGRGRLLRRDLEGAAADAAAALALLGEERSLVAAQVHLLQGALGYLRSQNDAAEREYRAALSMVEAIAPGSVAHANVLSNLAALEVARGRPADSYRDYDAGIAIVAKAAPGSYADARLHFNRGLASTNLRRLAEAEADVLAAVERFARVQPDGTEHLQAQAQLADIYNARGQHALAEARLRELLPRLQARDPGDYNTLALEYTLAYTISRQKRTEESLQAFRALLAKLGADRPDSLRADTLNAYGQVLTETDAAEDAIATLGEALQLYEARQRRGLPMASALIARGDTLLRMRRLDEAQADLDRALELRSTHAPGSVLEATVHHVLGKLHRARGEIDAALSRFNVAIEMLERERWKQSRSAELRALWTASYADFYREPLDLLLEAGRLPQAFELDQHYRGRELAMALARPGEGVDATLVPEHTIDVAAARARLAPDQALLSFVTLPKHSWVLLLDHHGLEARRIEHGKRYWREAVDALNVLWALPQRSAVSERAAVERSHRLYRDLFATWGERLDRTTRLLLMPDDALHEIPFAALATDNAERAADARYLVERFALATALRPFTTETADAAPEAAPGASASLLAFGDPFAGERRDSRDALRLRGVDPGALPAARAEATQIAALYGDDARALLGRDAVESAVASSQAGVLHFATHVILDPLEPLQSYVLLAPAPGDDGRLSAGEIATLRPLRRELVVLAGCASAQGANAAGEGLLGIARAWLVAGSERVLASSWAIADEPTARFMVDFHRRLRAPETGDVALAGTQREWLARARDRAWWRSDRSDEARPFFWAGFTLSAAGP